MDIHIGTSGYGYKEWKGSFYPETIAPKEMLRFYSTRFNAVEINYTFHHLPTAGVLTSWAEQVPDDFTFALKAPQVITHLKQLRNVADETDYLFRMLKILGGKQGPVLFEFPKSFHAKGNLAVLADFIPQIPSEVDCAFEFRSPTWLEAGIADQLKSRDFSLCIADTDEQPAETLVAPASWGYLRLRRSDYTEADLLLWLERIRAQPWERVYVFFKHEEETAGAVTGPEWALRLHELATGHLLPEDAPARPRPRAVKPVPAHLKGLVRHFTDLRDHTHGGSAVTRIDKEKLFRAAVRHLDRPARQALAEMNDALLLGTGTIEATGCIASADGGLEATWSLGWPEQAQANIPPVILQAFFGPTFHHPHLRGSTVGNWPLNVFNSTDATAELPTLRAIAAAELHNLVFRADYRIVPAITRPPGGAESRVIDR